MSNAHEARGRLCLACKWWDGERQSQVITPGKFTDLMEHVGRCMVDPPRPFAGLTFWPQTAGKDRCSRFAAVER